VLLASRIRSSYATARSHVSATSKATLPDRVEILLGFQVEELLREPLLPLSNIGRDGVRGRLGPSVDSKAVAPRIPRSRDHLRRGEIARWSFSDDMRPSLELRQVPQRDSVEVRSAADDCPDAHR